MYEDYNMTDTEAYKSFKAIDAILKLVADGKLTQSKHPFEWDPEEGGDDDDPMASKWNLFGQNDYGSWTGLAVKLVTKGEHRGTLIQGQFEEDKPCGYVQAVLWNGKQFEGEKEAYDQFYKEQVLPTYVPKLNDMANQFYNNNENLKNTPAYAAYKKTKSLDFPQLVEEGKITPSQHPFDWGSYSCQQYDYDEGKFVGLGVWLIPSGEGEGALYQGEFGKATCPYVQVITKDGKVLTGEYKGSSIDLYNKLCDNTLTDNEIIQK